MSEFPTDAIHAALTERLGPSLRGVVCYDGPQLDTRLRVDVEAQYTEGEGPCVRRQRHRPPVGHADDRGGFRLGDLDAVVRVFEAAWVARVPGAGPKEGCLFSVERGGGITMGELEGCIVTAEERLGG